MFRLSLEPVLDDETPARFFRPAGVPLQAYDELFEFVA